MNEVLILALALGAGLFLGVLYFGGLWWTVRRGIFSGRPGLWFLSSLLLRTAIAASGFYFIAQGDWRKLLVSLAGFLLARTFVMRLTRTALGKGHRLIEGGGP
jgi:F1F0 ATPase subunit 2